MVVHDRSRAPVAVGETEAGGRKAAADRAGGTAEAAVDYSTLVN